MPSTFRPLPSFAKPHRTRGLGQIRTPRQAKVRLPRSLNYARIKAEVEAAIASLSRTQAAYMPAAGTLPGRFVVVAETIDPDDGQPMIEDFEPGGQAIWDTLMLVEFHRSVLAAEIGRVTREDGEP